MLWNLTVSSYKYQRVEHLTILNEVYCIRLSIYIVSWCTPIQLCPPVSCHCVPPFRTIVSAHTIMSPRFIPLCPSITLCSSVSYHCRQYHYIILLGYTISSAYYMFISWLMMTRKVLLALYSHKKLWTQWYETGGHNGRGGHNGTKGGTMVWADTMVWNGRTQWHETGGHNCMGVHDETIYDMLNLMQ